MQPGQQVGLAPQLWALQQMRGERGAEAGGCAEEAAERGDQHLLIGELLGAEGSDQTEEVVDAQVVGEAFVGDRVGDEGVTEHSDAREPALQGCPVGLAEVVALIVPVAAADGPAVGVE